MTRCYHAVSLVKESKEAYESYRKVLNLKPGEPFGPYCSACCPLWYDEKGNYGVGPNPRPTKDKYDGGGLWHDAFERMYLPIGEFETDQYGNLRRKDNHDGDIQKYRLPAPGSSASPVADTEVAPNPPETQGEAKKRPRRLE